MLGVAPSDRIALTADFEPFEREFADRLVGPEAVVGAADEALLDIMKGKRSAGYSTRVRRLPPLGIPGAKEER